MLCQPLFQIAQTLASNLDVALRRLVRLFREAMEHIHSTAHLDVGHPIPSGLVLIPNSKTPGSAGAMEPESSGRSPFCNRLRSAPRFSRTSAGKPRITLKELPFENHIGRGGFSHENNVTEAGAIVYKYLYSLEMKSMRQRVLQRAQTHLGSKLSSPARFIEVCSRAVLAMV